MRDGVAAMQQKNLLRIHLSDVDLAGSAAWILTLFGAGPHSNPGAPFALPTVRRTHRMTRRVLSVLVATAVAGCADTSSTEPELLVAPVFSQQAGDPHGAELHFRTHLIGDEEAPVPIDTRAQGQVIFRLSEDGTSMDYKLIVANIENVTQAHIHLGQPGVAGGVVVWLYPQCPRPNVCSTRLIEGRSQGVLAEGSVNVDDVRGSFLLGQPDPFAALIANIRNGNAYVNAHTTQHPPGEIRGQLPD
jgi:hypothetical protein